MDSNCRKKIDGSKKIMTDKFFSIDTSINALVASGKTIDGLICALDAYQYYIDR
jgi:hypothetical protein